MKKDLAEDALKAAQAMCNTLKHSPLCEGDARVTMIAPDTAVTMRAFDRAIDLLDRDDSAKGRANGHQEALDAARTLRSSIDHAQWFDREWPGEIITSNIPQTVEAMRAFDEAVSCPSDAS